MRHMVAVFALTFAVGCATVSHRGPELPKLLENQDATHRVDILPGGHGSAVVINPDGYLLTCYHVAGDGSVPLSISIAEGDGTSVTLTARVVAYDQKLDLAVIKVDRHFDYPVILEDIGNVHDGNEVYNVGYPYFFGEIVGRGYIMKKAYSHGDLHLDNVIVVDMPDGPGTSGSGVFSAKSGKLVGIIKMMIWVGRPGVPPTVIRILTGVDDVKKFLDRAGVRYLTDADQLVAVGVPMSADAALEHPIPTYKITIVPAGTFQGP